MYIRVAQKNRIFFFRVSSEKMLVFDVLRATSKGQFKKKIKSRSKFFKTSKTVKNRIFFKFFSRYGIILETKMKISERLDLKFKF